MSEETEPIPDQLQVNKVVRILNLKPMKYTAHLLMKDGTERQIQCEGLPKCDYSSEARALLLVIPASKSDNYNTVPLCRFDDISILQVEENPT